MRHHLFLRLYVEISAHLATAFLQEEFFEVTYLWYRVGYLFREVKDFWGDLAYEDPLVHFEPDCKAVYARHFLHQQKVIILYLVLLYYTAVSPSAVGSVERYDTIVR